MAMRYEMDTGETRMVQIVIHSIHHHPFRILAARYELSEKYTGEILESGEADIEKHVLRAMVKPTRQPEMPRQRQKRLTQHPKRPIRQRKEPIRHLKERVRQQEMQRLQQKEQKQSTKS